MENIDLIFKIAKKCIEITKNTTAQIIFKYDGSISPIGEIVVYGFKKGTWDTNYPDFKTYFSYISLQKTCELENLYKELCDLEKELIE